ncbi:DUF2938 domain-containing protein [Alcanivorax jadensis]|uniref:DUF2938 domain-containing protein n=1 Tax=Alcanivorax jadensis TaxID=64988 RepID=UPI0026EE5B8C|nr:DUF2938 domain-containing protein [Alcanivorax jadensis]
MDNITAYLASMTIVGICATLVMDVWSWLRQPLLGVAPPNYAMVGRWLLHMGHGKFRHSAIATSPAMPGEKAVGWLAHYLTGLVFAGILLGIVGQGWIDQPTLAPALLVGIGTVAAPFLLMQPGMGAGIAASRTPAPNTARLQSLLTHGVFGIGLYLGGWVSHGLLG